MYCGAARTPESEAPSHFTKQPTTRGPVNRHAADRALVWKAARPPRVPSVAAEIVDSMRAGPRGFAVGDHVLVHLTANCDGGESPHFPTEDGAQGRITAMAPGTTHAYFVLFSGRPVRATVAGLPKNVLGRHYAEGEL